MKGNWKVIFLIRECLVIGEGEFDKKTDCVWIGVIFSKQIRLKSFVIMYNNKAL